MPCDSLENISASLLSLSFLSRSVLHLLAQHSLTRGFSLWVLRNPHSTSLTKARHRRMMRTKIRLVFLISCACIRHTQWIPVSFVLKQPRSQGTRLPIELVFGIESIEGRIYVRILSKAKEYEAEIFIHT